MIQKLLILCGIPFSGKSTLAHSLSQKYKMKRVDLDDVKFQLYGQNIKDELLEQKDWDKIYQTMYGKIEKLLKAGETVVHDTGNFTKYERGLVKKIADDIGVEAITIFINSPVEMARERLQKNRLTNFRFSITDEAFISAVEEMEPPGDDEKHLIIQKNDDIESLIYSIYE